MTRQSPRFYGLLRVHVEKDGKLTPLEYSVGTEDDFADTTVVDGRYTIAFCGIPQAQTIEQACHRLKSELAWFEPLLRGAKPDPWFLAEGSVPRVG